MRFTIAALCMTLGTCSAHAMDNNYPSPAREKIAQEITVLDRHITSTNKKEIMYFTLALVCGGLLYYCPEQHAKGFNTLYLTEALLRNGVLVVGGNCLRQFYDLRKKRLGYSNEKQELEIKLKNIRPNAITPEQKNKKSALSIKPVGKNRALPSTGDNLLVATKHRHASMPAISPRNSFERVNDQRT